MYNNVHVHVHAQVQCTCTCTCTNVHSISYMLLSGGCAGTDILRE